MRIRLPHNNWVPRPDQRPAWDYLENGGKHLEVVAHRRWGKDDLSLHRTAVAAFERVAGYWHMLPEYSQARKAIWDAVNPHTGKRRIDEAFPQALRATTREHEMQIVFVNGSTWQVIGSDSYDRLVGSAPAGIVYSEWALANPAARGYLRPILAENGGWQIFITTPRGKNHAWATWRAAGRDPAALALLIPATQTPVFTPEQLESERQAYIAEHGENEGQAQWEQEYMCSWEAMILGAYYSAEMRKVDAEGRIGAVAWDESLPVHTAWDLGHSDDTCILWYQVLPTEIHVLDAMSAHGKDMDWYISEIRAREARGYRYGTHWIPHDAKARTLASGGKSIEEMLAKAFGWAHVRVVPRLSLQDGIQACRKMLGRTWWDTKTEPATDALRSYHREWDEEKKCFRDTPVHDWSSHYADAGRYMAIAWKTEAPEAPAPEKPRFVLPAQYTFKELLDKARRKRLQLEQ